MNGGIESVTGYSHVNGIKMYYELCGHGKPLVLIHGGGSTIPSSFGKIMPLLAKKYRVIAMELQNHGRSGFRRGPETFEQDADDVATLLNNIGIGQAAFLGFSNGGTTALQLAIRHPELVNKLVLAAAAFRRDGFITGFFEAMQQATLESMPAELKDSFSKVNPDASKLPLMFEADRDRMIAFRDLPADLIKSIKAPALIINGDADVILPEHALELFRLIPGSQLAIVPGGHGGYIGEITALNQEEGVLEFIVSLILRFLA